MKVLLSALLFPVLALAAGYPPGDYHMSGFGTATNDLAIYGYDIEVFLRWDGGDTVDSLAGSYFSHAPIPPGQGTYAEITDWATEFYPEDPDVIFHEMYIEDGLLQGFRFVHYGDIELGLTMWFEGDAGYDFLLRSGGSVGTLERAPGYVSDVPEPATLTLLLFGIAVIARRRRIVKT